MNNNLFQWMFVKVVTDFNFFLLGLRLAKAYLSLGEEHALMGQHHNLARTQKQNETQHFLM